MTQSSADWSFTSDPEVMRCVRAVAGMAVKNFDYQRYAIDHQYDDDTLDDVFWSAHNDACIYLATHPHLVHEFQQTYNSGRFIYNLFGNGIYNPWVRQLSYTPQTCSISRYNGESSDDDMLDRAEYDDDHFLEGEEVYTPKLVRKLAVLCWFPERLTSNADPFGEKHFDLAKDRKSGSDPSHRNSDVAELVDMRHVLSYECPGRGEFVLVNNKAKLTPAELKALYLCATMDFTYERAASEIGISKQNVHKAFEKAITKLVTYLNNPKGE